jgi:hypothetical protein
LQRHKDNKVRDFTIYCGSTGWLTDDGEEWLEVGSGQGFEMKGTKVGEDQWNTCEDTHLARIAPTGPEETFDLLWF